VHCIPQSLLRELAGALRGLIDAVHDTRPTDDVTADFFERKLVYVERIDVIPRYSPEDRGDFSPTFGAAVF